MNDSKENHPRERPTDPGSGSGSGSSHTSDDDLLAHDPLTRPEYISAMVHFYRGEMYRSQVWRTRLDTTTNWAVVTAAGMVSFTFSQAELPADTMLLANVLIAVFLGIEARRYRYFAVFRARVRMIEENFYLPILRRNLHSPRVAWGDSVACDLEAPKFKTTMWEAVLIRLRRNYVWLFAVVLLAWVAKLIAHPGTATSLGQVYERTGFGLVPPALATGVAALFYLLLFGSLLTGAGRSAAREEIRGQESAIGRWNV